MKPSDNLYHDGLMASTAGDSLGWPLYNRREPDTRVSSKSSSSARKRRHEDEAGLHPCSLCFAVSPKEGAQLAG